MWRQVNQEQGTLATRISCKNSSAPLICIEVRITVFSIIFCSTLKSKCLSASRSHLWSAICSSVTVWSTELILPDGVSTMIPEALGYRHHTTEYWQFEEPRKFIGYERPSYDNLTRFAASPGTVRKCEGQEDPTCSASISELHTPLYITHRSHSTV